MFGYLGYLYNIIIVGPLYNGLILLIKIIPGIDAGIAVILFTIIIRLLLFPLSKKAIIAQVRMRDIQPEIDQLKVDYKGDTRTQSLKMMEIYKTKGIHPFSSMLLLFIQLPIIYALYSVFIRSGLPVIDYGFLYHFIHAPIINIMFLGLIDVTKPSIILSLGAAVAQYFQLEFSLNAMKKSAANNANNNNNGDKNVNKNTKAQPDMAQAMTNQMKYIFPVIIFIISYRLSAVLSIYWITTNLFTLVQEMVVRKKLAHAHTHDGRPAVPPLVI
jgi:YidC/Oxa1 family membrane protein insertase